MTLAGRRAEVTGGQGRLSIRAFGPTRPWVPAASGVEARALLSAGAAADADLTLELLDLDRVIGSRTVRARLGSAAVPVELELPVPDGRRRGYGLRLRVRADGRSATAVSAVEVLDGWWQSPRMAAITAFTDPSETARAVARLADWHVTVIQHYDWMWRHYRYEPIDGSDTFTDALGRVVSHGAVRAGVESGHRHGIAALAYGAVYGAEREHVERHRADVVFSSAGEPLSLGDTFFITDLRPGTPWRRRLLHEYAGAIRRFGFDGIHMDTYGQPHEAWAADGERLDFAALYPDLVAEAARRLARIRHGSRVVLNCVDGWPLEAVAGSPTACLYLELWPPDDTFADVLRWIERARAVADGRQVVIAAYAAALRPSGATIAREGALEVVLLLGSIIAAAGAYHHVLAENDRLLVEGYYPTAEALRPAEAGSLRALWRFGARHVHLLSDSGLTATAVDGVRLTDASGRPVSTAPSPVAGSVWLTARRAVDGTRLLHLVDLTDQDDDRWDGPKRRSPRREAWRLSWPGASHPVAASPWTTLADPVRLHPDRDNPGMLRLPPFRRWLMVIAPATR